MLFSLGDCYLVGHQYAGTAYFGFAQDSGFPQLALPLSALLGKNVPQALFLILELAAAGL
jgi:hypothetical protein